MKSHRFTNIETTRRDLNQAISLLDELQSAPNRPTDITEVPIHGVRVLEKLNLIETWSDDDDQYWAITRGKI